jgi:hypothetical protein
MCFHSCSAVTMMAIQRIVQGTSNLGKSDAGIVELRDSKQWAEPKLYGFLLHLRSLLMHASQMFYRTNNPEQVTERDAYLNLGGRVSLNSLSYHHSLHDLYMTSTH